MVRLSKPKRKTQPETLIKRDIKTYLEWLGWYVVTIQEGPFGKEGVADLYCLKNGRHVWIEVKTPKGKQSDKQKEFQDNINHSGGEYYLVRSMDDAMNLFGKK